MSEPKRYELYVEASLQAEEGGEWVKYEDYARLKAEVERLKAEPDALTVYLYADTLRRDDIKTLKAQVERLTAENDSLQTKATNIYNAMVVRCRLEEITHKANADSIISQGMMSEAMKLMEESIAIREQVERLTKAGDAMAEEIALAKRQDEGSRFDPIEMHYDHELIVKWNAAKEGKQP